MTHTLSITRLLVQYLAPQNVFKLYVSLYAYFATLLTTYYVHYILLGVFHSMCHVKISIYRYAIGYSKRHRHQSITLSWSHGGLYNIG